MYDFCLTFPFAVLLCLGGALAFLLKRSVISLASGVVSGLIIGGCAQWSLDTYQAKGKLCKPATGISLATTLAITASMFLRYQETHKFMPAGLVSATGALMCAFLVWNLTLFKPHLPVKRE